MYKSQLADKIREAEEAHAEIRALKLKYEFAARGLTQPKQQPGSPTAEISLAQALPSPAPPPSALQQQPQQPRTVASGSVGSDASAGAFDLGAGSRGALGAADPSGQPAAGARTISPPKRYANLSLKIEDAQLSPPPMSANTAAQAAAATAAAANQLPRMTPEQLARDAQDLELRLRAAALGEAKGSREYEASMGDVSQMAAARAATELQALEAELHSMRATNLGALASAAAAAARSNPGLASSPYRSTGTSSQAVLDLEAELRAARAAVSRLEGVSVSPSPLGSHGASSAPRHAAAAGAAAGFGASRASSTAAELERELQELRAARQDFQRSVGKSQGGRAGDGMYGAAGTSNLSAIRQRLEVS